MRYPALALLEYDGVAAGIEAADLMTKRAPVALLRCGTVHPGRYLVLLGGSVASVEEAFALGAGLERLDDAIFLPEVHEEVHDAVVEGKRQALESESLGVLETRGAPALLRAADAAVKGVPVRIAEIRLSDDLGGRAYVLLDGSLPDVEAALDIGAGRIAADRLRDRRLLPRLDGDLRSLLAAGGEFRRCEGLEPAGAEHLEDEHASG